MSLQNMPTDLDAASIDTQGMRALILAFPDHLEAAFAHARTIDFDIDPQTIDQIVVVGMGGSAIGADLARSLIQPQLHIPFHVVRSYTLPVRVSERSVVLVSSYSGNTEEPLSCLAQAEEEGAHWIGITSGGTVRQRATASGAPVVQVPGGMPPRAALGYSFGSVMGILVRLGFADLTSEDWGSAVEHLRASQEALATPARSEAFALAKELVGTVPMVYSGNGLTAAVNRRWRGQIQENSKVLAVGNVFPELNHNEIMGWDQPGSFHAMASVIVLRDEEDHPRIQQRMDITRSLLEPRAAHWAEVHSTGADPLTRLLSLVQVGDWVSYYLAILQERDPTPIPLINALKEALSS